MKNLPFGQTKMRLKSVRTLALGGTALGTVLALLYGCGTVSNNESGSEHARCRPLPPSKYVAATHDTDGKTWSITVVPTTVTGSCLTGQEGKFQVLAQIRDSNNVGMGGLMANAFFPTDRITVDTENSELNTDSCGNILLTLKYTCSAIGSLVIHSGALISDSINIAIEAQE